ncbi:unnamed protein product [Lepidochelys olivacea]
MPLVVTIPGFYRAVASVDLTVPLQTRPVSLPVFTDGEMEGKGRDWPKIKPRIEPPPVLCPLAHAALPGKHFHSLIQDGSVALDLPLPSQTQEAASVSVMSRPPAARDMPSGCNWRCMVCFWLADTMPLKAAA